MATQHKTRSPRSLDIAVEPAPSANLIHPELSRPAKGIYNSARAALTLGAKIGSGGEGTVYEIVEHSHLVAKLYHEPPSPEKAEKLIALAKLGTEALFRMSAWPVDVLRDSPGGNVIGFVMHKITQAEEVHALHSPKSRLQKFPDASWAFLLHVATNVARAVATMHEHGFVVGDVNPKNILVTRQATVYLLDCDSIQFSAHGKIYRCEGGFPEYTPPELQGRTFSEITRTQEHDCFGLAVVLFQLLFLGRHPFSGRFLGAGEMSLEQAIREGRFAYGQDAAQRQMQPPPATLALEAIAPKLAALFRRAFLRMDRPNPREWIAPLTQFSQSLQPCPYHDGHRYYADLSHCPWCELETRTGLRLFNFPLAQRKRRQEPFHLNEILPRIEQLEQITPWPQTAQVSSTSPSRAVLEYARKRKQRYWLSLGFAALTSAGIAWASDFPTAIWFLVFAGNFARRLAQSSPERPLGWHSFFKEKSAPADEPLQQQTRTAKKRLEAQLRLLQSHVWGRPNGENEYWEKIGQLKAQVSSYQNLAQQRTHKLQQLTATKQAQALMQFLQQHPIRNLPLEEFSHEQKRWLHVNGILTAAEITEPRLNRKGLVKPAQRQQLLAWRQRLEQTFYRENLHRVPPAERMALDLELDTRKTRLEDELLQTTHSLRSVKDTVEQRRQEILPTWIETKYAISQAEQDLQELAPQNRLLPIIVVMLLVFAFVSLFEPPTPLVETNRANTGHASRTAAPLNPPVEVVPTGNFHQDFARGEAQFNNGNYNAAYGHFQYALGFVSETEWEPKYARLYYRLCQTKVMLGEAEEYTAYLETQVSEDPRQNSHRLQLAVMYALTGKKAEAAEQLEALGQRRSDMAETLRQALQQNGITLRAPSQPQSGARKP